MRPNALLRTFLSLSLLTTAARAQCQVDLLVPGSGAVGSEFGSDVVLDGDWAAVAARSHLADRGAVWMFERVGGQWIERQMLVAADGDPDDDFGYELALDGGRLVVAAPRDEDPNGFDSGSAYVFQLQAGAWVQTQKLSPATLESQDTFGLGLALGGDQLLIGASESFYFPAQKGVVYAFEWDGAQFVETDVLSPSAFEWGFGYRVAMDGPRALVSGGPFSSNAYVYELVGGAWSEVDQLSGPGTYDWWGNELALDGATAMVVTWVTDASDVEVFVFEHDGSGWSHADTIVPHPDADGFGSQVALDGDRAWFGAFAEDELGMSTGAVHHYRREGGAWTFGGKWVDPAATLSQNTGFSIAVDGPTALVGSPALFGPLGEGKVHVLELPHPESYQYCFCEDALSSCGNEDLEGGCRSSTGIGGRLAFCGSASVLADDSRFVATNLRPNQYGLVYMGAGTNLTPLGAGLRCTSDAGAGQFRYTPQPTGPAGALTLGPGFVGFAQDEFPASGQIAPGDTWYFQCWYRDPAGACGLEFNTTNAVAVTFQP